MKNKQEINKGSIEKWAQSKNGIKSIGKSIERACKVIVTIKKSQEIDPSKLKERFTV